MREKTYVLRAKMRVEIEKEISVTARSEDDAKEKAALTGEWEMSLVPDISFTINDEGRANDLFDSDGSIDVMRVEDPAFVPVAGAGSRIVKALLAEIIATVPVHAMTPELSHAIRRAESAGSRLALRLAGLDEVTPMDATIAAALRIIEAARDGEVV